MTQPNIPAKVRPAKGRPKAARVKDHWISFRVTSEEHFQLIDKAERSGMGPGDYARSRALRGIARSTKSAPATATIFGDDTRAVFHELRKQGVNLNQIAHHCNRHEVPPPHEVSELAKVIMALWERLLAL
ncbi:MAG: plasmid mobilization relaxosome protein MobC [Hyphomicrobiaceae bacterium]